MKSLSTLILAFFLALIPATALISEGIAISAVVLRVSDGDTIVVRTADFEDIRVRLYGIDAPESKQPGGVEATKALRVLQGQRVTTREMDTDRYGRMVGLVEYAGRSVNLDPKSPFKFCTYAYKWLYSQKIIHFRLACICKF